MKCLFVCRGSAKDGVGHVVRVRTIARPMREAAETRIAVIGDDYVRNLFHETERDYAVYPDEESMLRKESGFADTVVYDLMRASEPTFQALGKNAYTVSLSPVFNLLSRVDAVFHRTTYTGADFPATGERPLVRKGLDYAIVSEHCRQITEEAYQRNAEQETPAVAISMGGTDAANKTLQVLDTIRQVPEKLLLWVLLGEGYMHSYQELVNHMRGSRHEIILAKTSESMWRILSMCSFAILAGGTTTYEAAFAGLPSITTLERESTYFLVQELVEKGASLCAGKTFAESMSALTGLVHRLCSNRRELMAMHRKSKGMIDGLGAQRIVDEIKALRARTA